MWVVAEYSPASLFSLRLGEATSTGAKTLLVPTPFAIRTALLDVAIRLDGAESAPRAFDRLRATRVAIRVPERIAVTNLFVKVRKPRRADAQDVDEDSEAMPATIAFREYAHMDGTLGVALEPADGTSDWIETLLLRVTYFGKRGSFFQILSKPTRLKTLPAGYLIAGGEARLWNELTGYGPERMPAGILQVLDDWGPTLTWQKVDVYTREAILLGSDRLRRSAVLPCRVIQSSRSFTYYERIRVPDL
jgi:hypothetical protein